MIERFVNEMSLIWIDCVRRMKSSDPKQKRSTATEISGKRPTKVHQRPTNYYPTQRIVNVENRSATAPRGNPIKET